MKKFTFTAIKANGSEIFNSNFNDELWFLRAMCEAQADGFTIIYAAIIDINDNGDAWNVTKLSKYCSEL